MAGKKKSEEVKDSRPSLTAAPTEDEAQFIGVPDDYTGPERQMRWQGGMRGFQRSGGGLGSHSIPSRPIYRSGDDLAPISEGWSRNDVEALQSALIAVGLIDGNDDITPGWFDETTHSAYRKLLTTANQRGTTWQGALAEIAANPIVPVDGQEEELPTITLSNPADLRIAMRRAFQQTVGEAPPELIEAAVSAYRGQQEATGERMIDLRGTGATVTEMADPTAFAEDYARREMPVEAGAGDMLQQLKEVNAWLGFD